MIEGLINPCLPRGEDPIHFQLCKYVISSKADKGDKVEEKLLVLTANRVAVLTYKHNNAKLDFQLLLLDIIAIAAPRPDEVSML